MGLKEFYQATARQEGREEGREEGRQEGREEGRQEGRQEVVSQFLKDGLYSAERIAMVLHVDEAEIREIEQNLKY